MEQHLKCSPSLIILCITDNVIMDLIVFTKQMINEFINWFSVNLNIKHITR